MNTIQNEETLTIITNKSKFIGFSFKIPDKNTFNLSLQQIKQEYPDATHIVYATRCLKDNFEKLYESTEPKNTSGKAIMNLLIAKELDNLAIIIVRYYGGIKLGVGPLKRTYTSLALDLIDLSKTTQIIQTFLYRIVVEYHNYNALLKELTDVKIINKKLEDDLFTLVVLSHQKIKYLKSAKEIEKI